MSTQQDLAGEDVPDVENSRFVERKARRATLGPGALPRPVRHGATTNDVLKSRLTEVKPIKEVKETKEVKELKPELKPEPKPETSILTSPRKSPRKNAAASVSTKVTSPPKQSSATPTHPPAISAPKVLQSAKKKPTKKRHDSDEESDSSSDESDGDSDATASSDSDDEDELPPPSDEVDLPIGECLHATLPGPNAPSVNEIFPMSLKNFHISYLQDENMFWLDACKASECTGKSIWEKNTRQTRFITH
jgi:hypothetical protein